MEQISRLLTVPIDALKTDFSRFRRNRKPAYLGAPAKEKSSTPTSDRLTIVEDDLLLILLHDDRLASPLAQVLDLSWVDLCSVSGRILAKILAETLADGPLSHAQIGDLLEDDEERDLYHKLILQEFSSNEPEISLRLTRQCLQVMFLRHTKKEEDRVLSLIQKSADQNPDHLSSLSTQLRQLRALRRNIPTIEFSPL